MTSEEAIQVLGLRTGVTAEERAVLFKEQRNKLEQKIAQAPTPGLQAKYREGLRRLDEAYETLAAGEDQSDLPSLRPVFDTPRSEAASGAVPLPTQAAASAQPTNEPKKRKSSGINALIAVLIAGLAVGGWYWEKANAKGGLMIKTYPSGATVTLGGEDMQQSPATFKGVKIGKYPLRVSLEGYESESRVVEIKENDFMDVGTIKLKPITGNVKVVSEPSGATVWGGSQELGMTPLELKEVIAGEVSYTLKLAKHKRVTVSGMVEGTKELVLNAKLDESKYPEVGERCTNSLGQIFAPVTGVEVLFGIWDVRVKDFEAFVNATGYDATSGMWSLRSDGWKQRGDTWKNPGFEQGPTHPVCGVSWEDAKAYCDWLTKKERKEGLISEGQSYRLPSDAEWSMAEGLGREDGNTPKDKSGLIKGIYHWGTQWPPPEGAGNYAGSEARDANWPSNFVTIDGYRDGYSRTSPVGSFKANKYGLYDMGGNLWQWCEDWYDGEQKYRVLRGGSWRNGNSDYLLSSYRDIYTPGYRLIIFGFRVVLVVGGSAAR